MVGRACIARQGGLGLSLSLFAVLPLAPAEPNLATCAPREPPATWRCRYGFPAPSAPQGCFLNSPTEAFNEAFISGGLLTTDRAGLGRRVWFFLSFSLSVFQIPPFKTFEEILLL